MRIRWSQFLIGLLCPLVAAGLQWELQLQLGPVPPFILFYPAIIIASFTGGLIAGFGAVFFSALLSVFFFLPPIFSIKSGSLEWGPSSELPVLLLFIASGTAISILNELLRRHRGHVEVLEVQRKADEGFRAVFECNAYAALVIVDEHGTMLRVSPQTEKVFGYRPEELIGQKVECLLPESMRRTHLQYRASYMEAPTRRPLGIGRDLVGRRKDGVEVPIEISLIPLVTKPRPTILVTITEITERKRIEENLARLAAIVTDSDDAIISKELDGVITSWNIGAERLFGYSADEIIGQLISVLIPEERIGEEAEILSKLRAGIRIEHFETVRLTKDQRRIVVSETVSPIRNGNGRIVGASKIVRDITPKKRAEAALLASERLYRAIGESIDYGIWVCDENGRNIYASDSLLKLLGISQQQCSEFGWGESLHPSQAADTLAAWKECVRTGRVWEREHLFLGVDGQWHPILARGVPIRDENGKVIQWAGINLDISRIKKTEAELQQALEVRDEFMSIASHELKTPLTALQLQLQLLSRITRKEGPVDTKKIAYMSEQGFRSSQQLSRLLDELLDLTRIRIGKITLNRQPVDLKASVSDGVAAVSEQARLSGSVITISADQSVIGNWDSARISQIISNMLSNAIKYGEGRPIEVTVSHDQDSRIAKLVVRDHGIGVRPEMQSKIFERFERAASRDGIAGLGLGLYITRQIIEAHGGSIRLESELGQGSTFTVELPL